MTMDSVRLGTRADDDLIPVRNRRPGWRDPGRRPEAPRRCARATQASRRERRRGKRRVSEYERVLDTMLTHDQRVFSASLAAVVDALDHGEE